MALLKFLINIFKAIGKPFKGKKGGKGKEAAADRLPGERRIGIYGPSNVGKSVFFTMLYKACRHDQEFRLDPEDPNTGKQLINNLNILRSGEWLPGTVEETQLNFKAAIRGGSQFPFSTRDYKGETIDLEQDSAAKENLIRYFQACDAILFLLSPEMIADPRKCEREIMNFTVMINQVSEGGGKGLRIPIGLMITKADGLAGFENQSQVVLVSRKAEYLKAKSFNEFVDGICNQYHVARNIVFQEQVRKTLGSLALFFDFLMTLSMEFQVFFVSSVGHVRKLETQDGKVATRPPEDPNGIGVKTPFLWVVDTIRQKERIAAFNAVRRFVFRFALIVLIFYSVFYAWHLLPHRESLAEMLDGGESKERIGTVLHKQSRRLIVQNFAFFSLPKAGAGEVKHRANELEARYKAHLFLQDELPALRTPAELRALAEGFGTDTWQREHRWFGDLRGQQQTQVEEGVWRHITAYNRGVAAQMHEFARRFAQLTHAATDAQVDSCRKICDKLVPVRGTLREEYDKLARECAEGCQQMHYTGAQRSLRTQWDDILHQLDTLCKRNNPGEDLGALRKTVQDFATAAKQSDVADFSTLAATAEKLLEYLGLMADALGAQSPGDARTILQQLREVPENDLKPVAGWAMRQIKGVGERTLSTQIAEHKKSGDLGWFEDPDTERRLRDTALTGQRGQALDRYKQRLATLKEKGAVLQLTVKSAPDGFVVVYWDPISQEWARSTAKAGFSMDVRWAPGAEVRVGLQKAGAEKVNACGEKAGHIFELHKLALSIACPGAGGAKTEVVFEGLEKLVNDSFVQPLSEAFPTE
jgi:hypothetical protein